MLITDELGYYRNIDVTRSLFSIKNHSIQIKMQYYVSGIYKKY